MYIIDTDGGVDDALCIAISLKIIGENNVIFSATYGNVNCSQSASNIHNILKLLNAHTEIIIGASNSIDNFSTDAKYVHGDDGMGGVFAKYKKEPFTSISLDKWCKKFLANQENTRVRILGIGPSTNIARYINNLGKDNIQDITLMAGSIFDFGNITKYAEFNLYNDPISFNEVINSGIDINIVPLDICRKFLFHNSEINTLKKFGPLAKILIDSHKYYMNQYKHWENLNGCFPHDSLAFLVMFHTDWFFHIRAKIMASENREKRGRIDFFDLDENSNVKIFLGGDYKKIRDFFEFSWIENNK